MDVITNYFAQQGLLGIIIIMLIGVVIWQQRRLDKKDEEIKIMNQAVNVVQEKRINDLAQGQAAFIGLGKDLVNANGSIQKSLDTITRVMELKK